MSKQASPQSLPSEGPFLTRPQLASRWHCSIRSLERLRVRGVIRSFRLPGGRVCYRLSDIERLEQDSEYRSQSGGSAERTK